MSNVTTKSWTDDLPVCNLTGAGFSTNQVYNDDGSRRMEAHKFNDRSFHCRVDDNTSIYAIFSGQGGHQVAESSLQRIAAEILLGQLNEKGATEEDVKEVLRQAFISAEKGYLDSIDSNLARKTVLQCELQGVNMSEYVNYRIVLERLNSINEDLKMGTSIVLALIYKQKLYICNIGTCRALLCKNDSNNVLRVVQLSVDHNLYNEDEILRLKQLGVDVQAFRQSPNFSTRAIGSYFYKAGYKDCDLLSSAISEPVIAQPEIVGPIPLDDSCRFLLLMSSGLCKTLSDVFANDRNLVNKEIVQMAVEQFRSQSTLMGVSQSVVHKCDQMHHDTFIRQMRENQSSSIKTREDIILLMRNFNFPMPNAINKNHQQVSFDPVTRQRQNNMFFSDTESSSITDTNNSDYTNTNSSTCSDRRPPPHTFDKNYKIKAYVDFSDYYKIVENTRQHGTLPANIDFD